MRAKSAVAIIGCVLLAALAYAIWVKRTESPAYSNSAAKTGVVRIHASGGTYGYKAIIADNWALRERGLGGRTGLGSDGAMLFIFEESSDHQFWMKDMLFGIDMVWLDAEKRVIHIERNVKPESFPKSFGPDEDSRYVLEFKEGVADSIGLKMGDRADF